MVAVFQPFPSLRRKMPAHIERIFIKSQPLLSIDSNESRMQLALNHQALPAPHQREFFLQTEGLGWGSIKQNCSRLHWRTPREQGWVWLAGRGLYPSPSV